MNEDRFLQPAHLFILNVYYFYNNLINFLYLCNNYTKTIYPNRINY